LLLRPLLSLQFGLPTSPERGVCSARIGGAVLEGSHTYLVGRKVGQEHGSWGGSVIEWGIRVTYSRGIPPLVAGGQV